MSRVALSGTGNRLFFVMVTRKGVCQPQFQANGDYGHDYNRSMALWTTGSLRW
jgi:hypothetical protein